MALIGTSSLTRSSRIARIPDCPVCGGKCLPVPESALPVTSLDPTDLYWTRRHPAMTSETAEGRIFINNTLRFIEGNTITEGALDDVELVREKPGAKYYETAKEKPRQEDEPVQQEADAPVREASEPERETAEVTTRETEEPTTIKRKKTTKKADDV